MGGFYRKARREPTEPRRRREKKGNDWRRGITGGLVCLGQAYHRGAMDRTRAAGALFPLDLLGQARMGSIVVIDGQVCEPEAAKVSVFDHGFLFGDSVYEVVRTRAGAPFLLRPHLERMRRSAAELYLDVPFTDEEIVGFVAEALETAANPESYVRIILTRGVGELELHPGTCVRPSLILIVRPLSLPPARFYERGIRLAIVGRKRTNPEALNPAAKTGNYLNNVLAIIEAVRRGADDAVMLNAGGHLAEGTTANVFFVREGTVHTPALGTGILEGITRGLLIRLLGEEGIPCREGDYLPDELRGADEAFLTSTLRDVMPVGEVDGERVGGAVPGPVTRRLMARFAQL